MNQKVCTDKYLPRGSLVNIEVNFVKLAVSCIVCFYTIY